MKVAVSTTGTGPDDYVDPRFARCQCFIVADPDTVAFEAIPNASAGAMSGPGIEASQAIAGRGVQAVIKGEVGPNAYHVLSAAGIRIFTGASGTVRQAIENVPHANPIPTSGRGMIEEETKRLTNLRAGWQSSSQTNDPGYFSLANNGHQAGHNIKVREPNSQG